MEYGSGNDLKYGSVLSFSLHLFVAASMIILSAGSCSAARVVHPRSTITAHTNNANYQVFIRTSCGATTYPRVCVTSLSAYADTIQTSPRAMAHAALSVTLSDARATSAALTKMTLRGAAGLKKTTMKPGEKAAMNDCLENLSDSVDELRRSIGMMGRLSGADGPHLELKMNDIQTWVSAALTDEDTCLDGFEGMTGDVRRVVRRRILNVAHLTSNALALVNALAATAAP